MNNKARSILICFLLFVSSALVATAQDLSNTTAPSKSQQDQTPPQRTEATLPDSPFSKPCPLSNPTCGETSFRERNDFKGVFKVTSPRHRVADKKFWFVTSGLAATTALHILAVNHCRHTVGIEKCEGGYGPFRAMQGLNIGLSAGMAAIGYGWKKQDDDGGTVGADHSNWWVIPAGTAAFMGATAIQQYRKHCPAGTHFNTFYCDSN